MILESSDEVKDVVHRSAVAKEKVEAQARDETRKRHCEVLKEERRV